ncbi:MAG: exonuclease domain-containing protein [Patescibacteria group bacterium]|nr:exonuclease domain-containing protein [Patescibacteria group bacterium]
MEDGLIILDVETTGVNFRSDELIEVAAIKVKNGEIVDRFESLIKPKGPLPKTVSELTGIEMDDLVDAPPLSSVIPKVVDFAGNLPIVGHNISFDLDFLRAANANLRGGSLDTLDLSLTILPKLPYHSMQYLSEYFQLPSRPTHRAMDDVLATWDLLIAIANYVQTFPNEKIAEVKNILAKSDWEWEDFFIKLDEFPAQDLKTNYIKNVPWEKVESPDIEVRRGELNILELSPDSPQIQTNISLASHDLGGILVVSSELFNRVGWSDYKLFPYYGRRRQFDEARWKKLITKETLKDTEAKLVMKVLLHGFKKEKFSHDNVFLTKDEMFLWEQKIAPFDLGKVNISEPTVMSFPDFWELVQEQPEVLKTRNIYLPQWLNFTEFTLAGSAKTITEPYLNAMISSRREFVHDYVTDHKIADSLFKLLNRLGGSVRNFWNEVDIMYESLQIKNIEDITSSWLGTMNVKGLKYAKESTNHLLSYYQILVEMEADDMAAWKRQVNRTKDLLEFWKLLSEGTGQKIYLEGWRNPILRIVKGESSNIWQNELQDQTIIIASNSIMVENEPDYMQKLLGFSAQVQKSEEKDANKPLGIVKNLPDRKQDDYEDEIFRFLMKSVNSQAEKRVIVFPNGKMLTQFFEDYADQFAEGEVVNQQVAGNQLLLKSKLADKVRFTMLITANQLYKYSNTIPQVDSVIFIAMPFDQSGALASEMMKRNFQNHFKEYVLPRAILKFRDQLAELHNKTNAIWLLDSRVVQADWAKPIKNSLTGFSLHQTD